MSRSIIADKCRAFAVRIGNMSRYLREEQREFVVSKQVNRSGTSIGANVTEAASAISRKEFLAKMYVALKECRETLYWIENLHKTQYLTTEQYNSIKQDCSEIHKILSSITKTTRQTLNKP